MKTFVIWHQIPDTDAICSALVYAQYLRDRGTEAEALALGEANTETRFVLSQAGVTMPAIVDAIHPGSPIVLVDHNETWQSIAKREDYELVGIIDHHKFGNISTAKPILIRVEPLASTCSVIRKIFQEVWYTPSAQMATLMISAILSDTLHFRSPTTTDQDRAIVESLNSIAQIPDIWAYAMEMFAAKSNLGDISVRDLVQLDYKQFEFGKALLGYGVIETTNPSYALGRQSEILTELARLKADHALHYVFLSIVDILGSHNTTIVLSTDESKLIQNVFGTSTHDHLANLGDRISRKKQLIPPIDEYLTKKGE